MLKSETGWICVGLQVLFKKYSFFSWSYFELLQNGHLEAIPIWWPQVKNRILIKPSDSPTVLPFAYSLSTIRQTITTFTMLFTIEPHSFIHLMLNQFIYIFRHSNNIIQTHASCRLYTLPHTFVHPSKYITLSHASHYWTKTHYTKFKTHRLLCHLTKNKHQIPLSYFHAIVLHT